MFDAMVMAKRPGEINWVGLGRHEYVAVPRIGEYIEMEFDGKAIVFRVVRVTHPKAPIGDRTIGDLHVLEIGPTVESLKQLFADS